jgi:hypothetical protein
LSEDQRDLIKSNLKKDVDALKDAIRRFYRLVYVPAKEGLKEVDLGIPTYGDKKGIDQDVYDKLRNEEEILERVASLVIKERYLRDKDFVKVQQIYDSMLKTPGESRAISSSVIEASIKNGVKQGLFGLGDVQANEDGLTCRYFKNDGTVAFTETEVLIKDTLCAIPGQDGTSTTASTQVPGETRVDEGSSEAQGTDTDPVTQVRRELTLRFKVPRGKISQIMGIMNYLQSKFQSLEMEIKAKDGMMSEDDYTNKISEALRQLGIDVEKQH